jgi:2-alkyl-3-oxoalkanoate reductase
MRVFVAGATGVVGRRLVPLLVGAGHAVTAVNRSSPESLSAHGARPVEVDLFDAHAVARAVAGHEAVINLATAIPSGRRAFVPLAWRENDRLRRHASRNLVHAAMQAGATRFVQESVTLGYVDSGRDWIDETVAWNPLSHLRSAVHAERAAQTFADQGGAGIVLRFALFHGSDSAHTHDTIRLARSGVAATFVSGEAYISSITTDDAALAVLAALHVPAGTYNISDDEPLTRVEYFAALGHALDRGRPRIPPAWMASIMGPVARSIARSHRISNSRFRRASGWQPSSPSMREGWRGAQLWCGHRSLP